MTPSAALRDTDRHIVIGITQRFNPRRVFNVWPG
jgi:hypothetical protein